MKKELEEANKTADQYEKALREALEENEKLRDRLHGRNELDSFRNGLKTPRTVMMTGGQEVGNRDRAMMRMVRVIGQFVEYANVWRQRQRNEPVYG